MTQPRAEIFDGYKNLTDAARRDYHMRLAAERGMVIVEMLDALRHAENALVDYIGTIEKTGASLYYGHSVLTKIRAAIKRGGQS